MTANAFAAATTPLAAGVNLIEAAAGTGKTYAIAMLVLRCVVEQGMDIRQILVVTFTRAATEELKSRIRRRLQDARQALKPGPAGCADADLLGWLDALELDAELVRQRLERALLNIDQAVIVTIHGFCQRALVEHALESGQMFDCEISGNIAALRQQCADDFWRRQLYQRPAWQAGLLTAVFGTPDELLASLHGLGLQQPVHPQAADLDVLLASLQAQLAAAAASLPGLLERLTAAFTDDKFKDSYVKAVPERGQALAGWLAEPAATIADYAWLTTDGLLDGLNGRKFMTSKSQPLSSDAQKRNYLAALQLDCAAFEQLHAAVQDLQVAFRRALHETLRQTLDRVLQQHNLLSFDDLIGRLHQAVTGAQHPQLLASLRQCYAAALIDEFQDTDSQQWQIFAGLFATSEHYLYLIGDPKQAIYKFRGADIYSYFAARGQADHCHTLLRNWRSHPRLVAGVNRLFHRPQPFLLSELDFQPIEAARSALDGGIGDSPPLQLWQLDCHPGSQPHWTSGKAAAAIQQGVVQEILDLLTTAGIDSRTGHRPLQPRDIAILVRSNAQALAYQQALHAAGIPAVLNSKQSVFASVQAQALYTVLQAVARPGQLLPLKQALTVDWFRLDGRQLYALYNDETALEDYLQRFQEYHRLWQERGLLVMMQALLRQEGVARHLAGRPQAERQLTDLHQLLECLQLAAMEGQLAVNKTLDWLRQAMATADTDGGEDRLLRLESDEDTVKIVTLHSAKGLEYPVVFCPNLWQRNGQLSSETQLVQCHESGEMIADLGSPQFAVRRAQAVQEELAEDLRLCYVALTRAKYRCYLAWADVRSKEKANDSALAYLLELAAADFAGQQQILQGLASAEPAVFGYRLLPADAAAAGVYRRQTAGPVLACRPRRRQLMSHWQMSSYTALSALGAHDAPELPVDKAAEPQDLPLDDTAEAAAQLPPGPQTGNVLHSLLETLSFQELAAGANIAAARDHALRRYGVQLADPAVLDRLLYNVVATPLTADAGFCLKNLPAGSVRKEMPFYLAMRDTGTARINAILAQSPAFQALSAKQMSGYLTGFIDLVLAYDGKYYVIDYKTNSLPDYRPQTLLKAMREHNYGLQYWLYSLVLDNLLRQRIADYSHARHFGGVKYLFVRGMCPDAPGSGVFADLPAAAVLRRLAQVFFAGD